mmetsp:Transcript_5488/g.11951  ORF Transcript_5488/g.11951 Transcript_5488/m.11951 type:complete len:89 (+) Transcript_5488:81-347(+)
MSHSYYNILQPLAFFCGLEGGILYLTMGNAGYSEYPSLLVCQNRTRSDRFLGDLHMSVRLVMHLNVEVVGFFICMYEEKNSECDGKKM